MSATSPAAGHSRNLGPAVSECTLRFDFSTVPGIPFPPTGLCRSNSAPPLQSGDINLLRQVGFSHYTVHLEMYMDGWQEVFRKANSEAKGLKVPMLVELVFGTNVQGELEEFIGLCNSIFPFVDEVLVLQRDHPATPDGLLQKILPVIREGLHHVRLGVGTVSGFHVLAEQPNDLSDVDFIVYTIPSDPAYLQQVAGEIQSARSFAGGRNVYVKLEQMRSASTDHALLMHDACNFLSRVKVVLESGVDSLSLANSTDEHGLLRIQEQELHPDYFILTDLLSLKHGFVIPMLNEVPGPLIVLAMKAGASQMIMIANPSHQKVFIKLEGLEKDFTLRHIAVDSLAILLKDPSGYASLETHNLVPVQSTAAFSLDALSLAILES